MVEDYRIKFHTGRAELTGQYTVNRRGNTKAITKYVERYVTPLGEFLPEIWREEAKEEFDQLRRECNDRLRFENDKKKGDNKEKSEEKKEEKVKDIVVELNNIEMIK